MSWTKFVVTSFLLIAIIGVYRIKSFNDVTCPDATSQLQQLHVAYRVSAQPMTTGEAVASDVDAQPRTAEEAVASGVGALPRTVGEGSFNEANQLQRKPKQQFQQDNILPPRGVDRPVTVGRRMRLGQPQNVLSREVNETRHVVSGDVGAPQNMKDLSLDHVSGNNVGARSTGGNQNLQLYPLGASKTDDGNQNLQLYPRRDSRTDGEDNLWKTFLQMEANNQRNIRKTFSVAAPTGGTVDERCPKDLAMFDPEALWFKTKVIQRSEKGQSTSFDEFKDVDDVLILSPISNSENTLRRYFENICSLTYPHKRISIVLGEDSSTDRSLAIAEEYASRLSTHFHRIEVLKLSGHLDKRQGNFKHDPWWQLIRRRHLAMVRNELLSKALRTEKYVLWLDADVRHIPSDLIEHLMFSRKQIIVPNCLYKRSDGSTDTFDRNTWRETNNSLSFLEGVKKDYLMLEGYDLSRRLFLNDLKTEGNLVEVDGVGGCVLLIEANLHRKGLIFPPFIFNHHIETEGLAKIAADMDIKIYGLPSLNVIHW